MVLTIRGIIAFVRQFRPKDHGAELSVFAERVAKGSKYDPIKGGLNESFAGELLERCGIGYLSFDIARGYKTEILNLNCQSLPSKYRKSFDSVFNIGTTEHVLNQYNSFEVIHDATKVGGYMIHQLPVSGFTNHGYFVYTGRLFFEIAATNQYEIVDLWYDGPAGQDELEAPVTSFKEFFPQLKTISGSNLVPNYAMTIILRKTQDKPFAASLDTSTSVGEIANSVKQYHWVVRVAVAILGFNNAKKVKRLLDSASKFIGGNSWGR